MSNRSPWVKLLGVVYFFFWWAILPAQIVAVIVWGVLGKLRVAHWLRLLFSRTVGWVKMKLGFWQPIAYSPRAHSRSTGYGSAPSWVRENVAKKAHEHPGQDKIFDFSGRSFRYRVHTSIGKDDVAARYYRKLKAPRYKRASRTLLPRRPRTRTEWVIKIGIVAVLVSTGLQAI